MHARNRRTGAAITGTLETVYGHCKLIPDAFERGSNGRITHEHEGGTAMFWDTSKQVVTDGERIYLDENDQHVPENEIELHAADGAPESAPPARPRAAASALHDPEAAARGIAERFITSMAADVDAYHEALAAAREVGRTDGEDDAEKAVSEAHDAFVHGASTGVDRIEVASGLVDLVTARDALAPSIRHVETAVIRMEGPNAIEIRCLHDGDRFYVEEVSAREYARVSRVKPDKASAAQADVYSNAILQAWGL